MRFNVHENKPGDNIVRKGEMIINKIFSFSHNISTPFKTNLILVNFILSPTNALNLNQSKILLFDKELHD